VRYYLVDTNVVSELVRPSPAPSVIRFLGQSDDLWLSVVTLHELAFGLSRVDDARRRAKLEGFIAATKTQFDGRILEVGAHVAEMAGRLRALAASKGHVMDPLDSFIGATAITQGATLATRNVKDFDYLEIALINPWDS
jgi:predicted nucleic acid-binding protein